METLKQIQTELEKYEGKNYTRQTQLLEVLHDVLKESQKERYGKMTSERSFLKRLFTGNHNTKVHMKEDALNSEVLANWRKYLQEMDILFLRRNALCIAEFIAPMRMKHYSHFDWIVEDLSKEYLPSEQVVGGTIQVTPRPYNVYLNKNEFGENIELSLLADSLMSENHPEKKYSVHVLPYDRDYLHNIKSIFSRWGLYHHDMLIVAIPSLQFGNPEIQRLITLHTYNDLVHVIETEKLIYLTFLKDPKKDTMLTWSKIHITSFVEDKASIDRTHPIVYKNVGQITRSSHLVRWKILDSMMFDGRLQVTRSEKYDAYFPNYMQYMVCPEWTDEYIQGEVHDFKSEVMDWKKLLFEDSNREYPISTMKLQGDNYKILKNPIAFVLYGNAVFIKHGGTPWFIPKEADVFLWKSHGNLQYLALWLQQNQWSFIPCIHELMAKYGVESAVSSFNEMFVDIPVDEQHETLFRNAKDVYFANKRREEKTQAERKNIYDAQSDILHALGTPLSKLGTLSSLMEKKYNIGQADYNEVVENLTKEQRKVFYERVWKMTSYVTYLIRIIDSFQKNEYSLTNVEQIDLRKYISNMMRENKLYYENVMNFSYEMPAGMDPIILPEANQTLLNMMFDSLIDNAFRHSFAKTANKDNRIHIMLELKYDLVVIKVCNNGAPFEDTRIEEYVTRGRFNGKSGRTGLGGAHVKSIVELHQGHIVSLEGDEQWPCIVTIEMPIVVKES